MNDQTAQVVYERETRDIDGKSQIIRIGSDFFYRGWASLGNESSCSIISATEARRTLLQWGESPERVAELIPLDQ